MYVSFLCLFLSWWFNGSIPYKLNANTKDHILVAGGPFLPRNISASVYGRQSKHALNGIGKYEGRNIIAVVSIGAGVLIVANGSGGSMLFSEREPCPQQIDREWRKDGRTVCTNSTTY